MSVGLYLRSFCGFALQLVPCAMLLPVPFREEAFAKGKRWAYAWLAALALVFSLCYPLSVWLNMGQAANGNLDDNLFMLAAIAGVTALYARITRVNLMRKFSALFIVISYAAVQFFLANMLMDFRPLAKQDMLRDGREILLSRGNVEEIHSAYAAYVFSRLSRRDGTSPERVK